MHTIQTDRTNICLSKVETLQYMYIQNMKSYLYNRQTQNKRNETKSFVIEQKHLKLKVSLKVLLTICFPYSKFPKVQTAGRAIHFSKQIGVCICYIPSFIKLCMYIYMKRRIDLDITVCRRIWLLRHVYCSIFASCVAWLKILIQTHTRVFDLLKASIWRRNFAKRNSNTPQVVTHKIESNLIVSF